MMQRSTCKNIMPFIDKGVFHNFMFMCASNLFVCDVIRLSQPIVTSFVNFLLFYNGVEEKVMDKRKDHGAVGEPSLK